MADAGAAVYMEYGTTSYARDVDATEALRYTFGYDKAIDMAEREYFTAVAWDEAKIGRASCRERV